MDSDDDVVKHDDDVVNNFDDDVVSNDGDSCEVDDEVCACGEGRMYAWFGEHSDCVAVNDNDDVTLSGLQLVTVDTCTVHGGVDGDGFDDNDFVDRSFIDVGVDDVNVVCEYESFNDDDDCHDTLLHGSGDNSVVNNGGGGDSAVADDAVVSATPISDACDNDVAPAVPTFR